MIYWAVIYFYVWQGRTYELGFCIHLGFFGLNTLSANETDLELPSAAL